MRGILSAVDLPSVPPADAAGDVAERQQAIDRAEPRNLLVLAVYEVIFRVAWIFKTESVIVPAFLDALTGGTGSIRGWLPTLSRLGQSVPPLFVADWMRGVPSKSRVMRSTSLLMAFPAAAVAWMAWSADRQIAAWMPLSFLALYVLFFSITGLNQLAQGTLHGKLIRADRRGRLMWLAGVIGPLCAIAAAWWLLGPWLERPGVSRFMPIFTLTAAGFFLCGCVTFCVREPDDPPPSSLPRPAWAQLRAAWSVYRGDAQFRRAARVVMLLTSIVLIFPHFQWLAREELDLGDRDLMFWVIAQNVGVACFSPLCGLLGDRCGNRLVLRLQCVVLTAAPLVALALAAQSGPLGWGRSGYWIVFLLLGMSPVTMRTINNYTLELAGPELHPLYLSTMRVCFLAPFLLSPAAGAVLDYFADRPFIGACWLFGTVSGLILLAGVLTWRMAEPRWQRPKVEEIFEAPESTSFSESDGSRG